MCYKSTGHSSNVFRHETYMYQISPYRGMHNSVIMIVEIEALVYKNTKIFENVDLTQKSRLIIVITITIICSNTKFEYRIFLWDMSSCQVLDQRVTLSIHFRNVCAYPMFICVYNNFRSSAYSLHTQH